MDKLFSPTTVNQIIKKYDFKFTKTLGQNFLIDENIIQKILQAVDIKKEDLILEIGPGIGTLTAAAAEHAGSIKAIEVDRKLIPILKENLKNYNHVEIIHQDVLKTDLSALIADRDSNQPVKVMGNLPYYITTPIIMKILEEKIPVESITIMLQKEVAQRIKANPGTKAYGALTLAVQYYSEVEYISDVPKTVFIPKPNVDSSIIRLDIRKQPPVDAIDEKLLFKVIQAGFNKRRKTLLNALNSNLDLNKESLESALNDCGIDPKRRAETLTIEEFASLSNQLSKITDKS